MTADRTFVPGQVRVHLHRTPTQRARQWWITRRIGQCGSGAFIERGVEILRYPEKVHLGADTIIKSGARILPANGDAEIRIGDWTTIGYHTHVIATSHITIGRDCLIAPFCYLVDSDHGIARDRLIREQPMASSPIIIGDDVWVGAGTIVLAGATIGAGAVIAAGSVVKDEVAPYTIWAGTPARQVSERRL